MSFVNSIDYTAAPLPYFVTLTYHNTWPEDPRAWKEQLKSLKKRMERLYRGVTLIWRLEYQKRGAPHFHLLLWIHDLEQLIPCLGQSRKELAHDRTNRLRNNISWMWNEIADPTNPDHLNAGTNVSECKKLRHLNGYLSKYVAKVEQLAPGQGSPGKMWGKMHPDWLPISPVEVSVEYFQFVPLRRILRKYSHQKCYSPAPKPGQNRQVYGMSCFVSDTTTTRLLAWLGIIGSDAAWGSDPEDPARADAPRGRMSTAQRTVGS